MISTVASSLLLSGQEVAGITGAVAVALIFFLILRELSGTAVSSGGGDEKLRTFAKLLVVPIAPLLVVFAVIVAVKVWEVL